MRGALDLALSIVAGLVILDVVLDLWHDTGAVQRRRRIERDKAEMRRTIERTGGPRR